MDLICTDGILFMIFTLFHILAADSFEFRVEVKFIHDFLFSFFIKNLTSALFFFFNHKILDLFCAFVFVKSCHFISYSVFNIFIPPKDRGEFSRVATLFNNI